MGSTRHINFKSIDNGNMGGNVTGSNIDISLCNKVSVQTIWANGTSPVGDVQLQVSNDGGTTFNAFGATMAVSGASGNDIELPNNNGDCPFDLIRAVYNRTSGSGIGLDVYIVAKGGGN